MGFDADSPSAAPNNFGRASHRDTLVFASSRPAFAPDTQAPGVAPPERVHEWCEFVRGQDVSRVLSLLGDEETKLYADDVDETMRREFGEGKYARVPLNKEGAADGIWEAIRKAEEVGEKIVVHCNAGNQRAGLGVGVWLMKKYGLSAEEASKEIGATAVEEGTVRGADPKKLDKLVHEGSLAKPK